MSATTAPALNGQVIGRAHYATRAVLERRLEGLGLTFQQGLVLNALAAGDKDRDQVIDLLASSLKIARTDAEAVVDSVLEAGLVDPSGGALTEAGRSVQAEIGAETVKIVSRLYAGLPADELAVAARVLTTLTERANAELA
ncbi:MarR family winged helix-turn-helix transcriptional regulator [Actinomadura oligospora]|uniref:MarR family winged helix-turn-helix transcriptional regulator n=1 Tax=Actinomadura oligospora TaxID=111804 RepID=UPI00047E8B03|nr:MarR family winged helix-turn-helix transcriptional regulator [Actinomadura oligospora]